MDLGSVADRLYAVTPAEFVAARNDESAGARSDGDAQLAAAIRKLPKPSSSAWLVNALARQSGRFDELFELGAAMRQAQDALDGDQLRQLSRRRHQVFRDLLAAAADVAEDAGSRLADAVARGVTATLEAALVDEGAAQAVRSGLLVRTLTSSGFEPVDLDGALAVSDGPPRPVPIGRATLRAVESLPPDRPARVDAAQRALTEAIEDVATAERALMLADSGLDSVADNLDRARTRVADAERALADARAEVAALEKDRIRAGRDRDAAMRRRDSARRLLAKAQAAADRRR